MIHRYQKKEVLRLQKEMDRLELTLGGIKHMDGLPHLAFIIDPNREDIAVNECRKLGIPIVAVTDTNSDPDLVDYIIPGNDDAIRAIKLFVSSIADACLEGQAMRKPESDEKPESEDAAMPPSQAAPETAPISAAQELSEEGDEPEVAMAHAEDK